MLVRKSSESQGSERLAERRRLRRRRISIALLIFSAFLLGAIIWGLWQPAVRVSQIQVFGPPSLGSSGGASADNSYATYAQGAMGGTYFHIIPRNSVFFIPEHLIRANILAANPGIASVSIFREGFTGISIRIQQRTAVGYWCGLSPSPQAAVADGEYCYVFDANGFIFAASSTAEQTLVPFALYDSLVGDAQEPLQATLANADNLPAVFDFARGVEARGAPVERIIIRGDEVDDILASNTRITYVLGQERDAFAALVSAKEDLNLLDGVLEYVDLRFPGKVYVKKNSPPGQ